MKIVLIGTAFPMRGGIAHYVALLYKYLQKNGHEVHVLAFKRQYPAIFFPGKTQADESQELIPVESTPILDSIGPFSWIKAYFWIKKIKPDLLVFKYWMPFFAPCYAVVAWMSKRFLGARSLYVCDNIIPHEKKPFDILLTRLGLKFIDHFIVQSKSVREDLLHFHPDADYKEVPHPVYEIFPPAVSKDIAKKELGIIDSKVILYFGFIRKYKGLRYLVEAMPEILKTENVKLVICGEFYEGREEILTLISKLGLSGNILLADKFIPNEAVGTYFCAADLVVLPYVTATQSGIVQIAYNYDKPVIVTRVGGLPEVVIHEKTGFVAEPESAQSIADNILRFYAEKREVEFSANVKEEKKKYSWDRMAEAVGEFGSN